MSGVDFDRLYEPLTADQEQALRDDIRAHGVRQAILVTADGTVIAGRHRKRIADELGLAYSVQTLEGTPGELLKAAVLDNPQRRLAPAQRAVVVEQLRAEGWSLRRIAEVLGVSKDTIGRAAVSNETPLASTPKAAKTPPKPAAKAPNLTTPSQRRRRQAKVVELVEEGYKHRSIEQALGLPTGTVTSDLRAAGVWTGDRRRIRDLRDDLPPAYDWRSEPEPEPDPAYRRSTVVLAAAHWVEGFNGGDHPNRLAHNLLEAEAQGDTTWLAYARELIEAVHEQSGRLVRVLNDADYRERCRRGTDLDVRTRSGSGPTLRAVE